MAERDPRIKRTAEGSAEHGKDPKKSRGEYDPKAEAVPMGRREVRPVIESVATSKESEASPVDVEAEAPKGGQEDDVFFPGNKTVADMSQF